MMEGSIVTMLKLFNSCWLKVIAAGLQAPSLRTSTNLRSGDVADPLIIKGLAVSNAEGIAIYHDIADHILEKVGCFSGHCIKARKQDIHVC